MTAEATQHTAPARPRLRLSGPSDLVACVPYLLGFVPTQSAVLLVLDERRELVLSARADLPPDDTLEGWLAGATALGRYLGAAGLRAGGASAVCVLYPPPGVGGEIAPDNPWRAFAGAFADSFAPGGTAGALELIETVLVCDGRWWSLQCEQQDCCPRTGRPLPAHGTTAAEAGAVAAGMTFAASRDEVASQLEPAPDAESRAVEALIGSAWLSPREGLALVDGLLARRCEGATDLAPEEIAGVLRAVDHVLVRDAVSWCGSAAEAEAATAFWKQVVRVARGPWVVEAAMLLAAAAYQLGDGLLAALATERLLREDPDHVMGSYLAQALDEGLPPAALRPVFEDGSAQARVRITHEDREMS